MAPLSGAIVLINLSVIIGTIVASNLFEKGGGGATAEDIKTVVQQTLEKELEGTSKKNKTPEELDSMDLANMSKMDDMLTFETGKITSNSKGSSNTFVVLELAIDFRIYDKENPKTKDIAKGEGDKTELNLESPTLKKIKIRITSKINELIATYSEAEFQAMRPELKNIIRTQLRPIFSDFNLQLGDVQIITFIIQQS